MAQCANCSAPLPANSITCEYCGSRNDIDLKGVHYNTTHAVESDRICPRCGTRMQTIDLKINGKFLIERCEQCLGLFFDPNELEAVIDATVTNVYSVDRIELDRLNDGKRVENAASYVKCPVCSTLMNRVNFGARSGVVVNRCRDHGVWLDAGDLRRLFEWSKAGGRILDQERQEQRKKEVEENEKRRPAPQTYGNCNETLGSYADGSFGKDELDLVEIVWSAIRFFTR